MTCEAKQQSDQMYCAKCALTWDMNDPEPPLCPKKEAERVWQDRPVNKLRPGEASGTNRLPQIDTPLQVKYLEVCEYGATMHVTRPPKVEPESVMRIEIKGGKIKRCDILKGDDYEYHTADYGLHYIEKALDTGDVENLIKGLTWAATPQGNTYWNRIYSGGKLTDEARGYLQEFVREIKKRNNQ